MSRHSSPPGQPCPAPSDRGGRANRKPGRFLPIIWGKGRHRTMDANIMDQPKPAIPTLGRYAQLDRVRAP
ncbi:hypothetical protein, partial [Komagataeibacter saccharivorans]|uniref:hypothetical protein n=1 Tax=Komagataeibacter saccharivorans TaxID=265959 RepID=UPI0039E916F7